MKRMSEPIVFFGSGPVAAKSLELLLNHCAVEAVVTKPRASHHKGDVPVLTLAKRLGLPVKTVSDRSRLDELIRTKPFFSKLGVLVDFGIIVSQTVIDYFPLGIVNSHFSLLPEWRGADPITFAILSGQQQTGVSLMLLTAGMDEGPLLAQAPYDIPSTATTPQLTEALIELSDSALAQILPLWEVGSIQAVPQTSVSMAPSTEPSYSRKLTKEDGLLDWQKSAEILEREIRAFTEWPKSRAKFGGLDVIIMQARVAERSGMPGTITIVDKKLAVFCGERSLVIETIKPAGKRAMSGEAFLAGYRRLFL